MGCHFLLQEAFPTQGSNPGLLHCRQILYPLSHQGSPQRRMYCIITLTDEVQQRCLSFHGGVTDTKIRNLIPGVRPRVGPL